MNTAEKKVRKALTGTENLCHYCGSLSGTEDRYCMNCGAENRNYDHKHDVNYDDSDCKAGHVLLKAAVVPEDPLCYGLPFCEDCGVCALPSTWRKHLRPTENRVSYELVLDGKQVAHAYLFLTEDGALDPNAMTLNRPGANVSFEQLYEHIEKAPNLPDEVRGLLMASKDRWDVRPGDQVIILLKQ